ncbi:hypothetical protein Sjap_018773 [Stephania japonica]|uniref:BHLH domain-containing protein n=1 Tax=Stephania japonica TaxID=461633 RepID=A0AAP0I8M9_9MAGN
MWVTKARRCASRYLGSEMLENLGKNVVYARSAQSTRLDGSVKGLNQQAYDLVNGSNSADLAQLDQVYDPTLHQRGGDSPHFCSLRAGAGRGRGFCPPEVALVQVAAVAVMEEVEKFLLGEEEEGNIDVRIENLIQNNDCFDMSMWWEDEVLATVPIVSDGNKAGTSRPEMNYEELELPPSPPPQALDDAEEEEEELQVQEATSKNKNNKSLQTERKRRKRINEQLYTLRSLVPNITKMDKRSVLVDALAHLQSLHQKIDQEMEKSTLSSDEPLSYERCAASPSILEINVEMHDEKRYMVDITSNETIGVLGQVQRAVEMLGFKITSSSISKGTYQNTMITTFFVRVKKKRNMNQGKLLQMLKQNARLLGLQIPHDLVRVKNGCVVLLSLFSLYYLFFHKKKSKLKTAPEAPGAWPILGHLHLFSNGAIPHVVLGAMADRFGPAFTIRLGVHRALVVSRKDVAKECLTTNDRAFASRPISIGFQIMGYNNSLFAFAPYGEYWRNVRKLVIQELLSQRRLEMLKHVWISEIDTWVDALRDTWRKGNGGSSSTSKVVLVDMKKWFEDLMMNIVVRLVVGKKGFMNSNNSNAHEARAFLKFFHLVNAFILEDAIPFLRRFDLGGRLREMKSVAREMDGLLQGWLDEHKSRRKTREGERDGDFMDVMLSVLEESGGIAGKNADTVNKATCLNLILGASDTTMITLTWALSLLLNNKPILNKALEELKAQVGTHRHVDESDMKSLVYIQAIIKETLRLYPAGPLPAAHVSMEDTTVNGYDVPAGTQLIVNVWKIQRDQSTWPDPLEFRPERFLTTHKDVDVWGQHFELTPFGSGRRSCPGIAFALRVVPLAFARLLHEFEFSTPKGAPVDMTETAGLTNVKATPLMVQMIPRRTN